MTYCRSYWYITGTRFIYLFVYYLHLSMDRGR